MHRQTHLFSLHFRTSSSEIVRGSNEHTQRVRNAGIHDGTRVFITNIEDGTVLVIDVATQKVIDSIKVGKGPNSITFRSAPR